MLPNLLILKRITYTLKLWIINKLLKKKQLKNCYFVVGT